MLVCGALWSAILFAGFCSCLHLTKPNRKHFFGIARGSVQECVPKLELARRRKLVSEERHAKLKQELEEISRMLSGLMIGLDNRET